MRILLVSLYSDNYPATGETHALSVLAGQLAATVPGGADAVRVVDMVALGRFDREHLLRAIAEHEPELVGVSVSYGTYSLLETLVSAVRTARPFARLVYGGPLATYLAERILEDVDPGGVVVLGEGEIALSEFVRGGCSTESLHRIQNVAFRDWADNGVLVKTTRALVPVEKIVPPARAHLTQFVKDGIQLYAEASRGCSWSHCTFCLRGLLDLHGHGSEYRGFPTKRLLADLHLLSAIGATTVTFSDEDFLGGDIERVRSVARALAEFKQANGAALAFDASMTVHSIFSEKMSVQDANDRSELLKELRDVGLRKVFLGIESGSPSQLKRLAKGHSAPEARGAIETLRANGILVELGWIMFDPLCDLDDVRTNIAFLRDTSSTEAVSFLFNELRLQEGTNYLRLLDIHERRTGVRLRGAEFDPDTLSYSYTYEDSRVERLVHLVRAWSERVRLTHYPMKNLTRYGVSGDLAPSIEEMRALLSEYRHGMCDTLLTAIASLEKGDLPGVTLIEPLQLSVARRVDTWISSLPASLRSNELVRALGRGSDETQRMSA